MNKLFKTFFFFVVLIFLASCGVTHRLYKREPIDAESSSHAVPAMSVARYNRIQKKLRKAYHKWKGTSYDWGGQTLHGVDCSALMQNIFNYYFNTQIPRTTEQQLYAGIQVSRENLKPGDLVFFKTGRKTLHVGIIIDQPKFIHASTSQGVTISSLQHNYWDLRYLTAKRILD